MVALGGLSAAAFCLSLSLSSGRFGFIKYKDRKHAEHARRELNGSKLGENQIRVVWHHTHGSHYFREASFPYTGMYPRQVTVHVQFEMDPVSRWKKIL